MESAAHNNAKNNSRDSYKIKGFSPLQLSCNLTGKCHAVGYYFYTWTLPCILKLLEFDGVFLTWIKALTMLTKEKLKEQIELLPEEFSIDELVERLIFIQKVERGEKQSLDNDVIEHAHLDKEIEKWFK